LRSNKAQLLVLVLPLLVVQALQQVQALPPRPVRPLLAYQWEWRLPLLLLLLLQLLSLLTKMMQLHQLQQLQQLQIRTDFCHSEKTPQVGRFFCVKHFNPLMSLKAPLIVGLTALLSACQGINPVMDTANLLLPSSDFIAHYQQGVEYLKVGHSGRQAAMALGGRKYDGAVVNEYWYSGQREMLHLKNGRLHNAMGMTQEVRAQTPMAPSWEAISDAAAHKTGTLVWSRTRDLQPGYRYGVVEYVTSKRIEPSQAQQALVSNTAQWFEDQVKSKTPDGKVWHYTEQFAVVGSRVMYSLQCVGRDLCLSLQPLGVVKP
jgi:hypothetical protein